jgi:small subunit ribosomal protein S15
MITAKSISPVMFYSSHHLCYTLPVYKGEKHLEKQQKADIIDRFKQHDGDNGSTEVQVAVLTERINQLTGHMAVHNHDAHTKRSLLKLVGQRRRLLAYLNKDDVSRYKKLIKDLGLRK